MLTLGETDPSMKNPSSNYGPIQKMLENRQNPGKFPTSDTTSPENISLASLRSSLRKPYANSLKTKAVNPQTRPTCSLVAGLGPLSLLFVCLLSLMQFEIRAGHVQAPVSSHQEKIGVYKEKIQGGERKKMRLKIHSSLKGLFIY